MSGNGAYKIEVSVQPLCPHCGDELHVGLTWSKPATDPFDRDNPYERKDRRVFINHCEKCCVFRDAAVNAAPDLLAAAQRVLAIMSPEIPGSPGSPMEDLRAAIVKAGGAT